MAKENNTLARVSTSDNIEGCLQGYGACVNDIFFNVDNKDNKDDSGSNYTYKGGYYIYRFKNTWSLYPSSKLVPDVDESREHWIVSTPKHPFYTANVIGRVIVLKVELVPVSSGDSSKSGKILHAIIKSEEPIKLSKDHEVQSGVYFLSMFPDKVTVEKASDKDWNKAIADTGSIIASESWYKW